MIIRYRLTGIKFPVNVQASLDWGHMVLPSGPRVFLSLVVDFGKVRCNVKKLILSLKFFQVETLN